MELSNDGSSAMFTLDITPTTLTVRYERWTRLFVRRSRTDIPLAAIREVVPVARPLAQARGLRAGLVVNGVLKAGTWSGFDGVRRLVCARRGEPGLRIVLDRRIDGVDELVLSLAGAEGVRRRLAGAAA
ncbi:hypothetical protein [Nonomuraea diastatica]|uniref:Uncharacterized protein n=1 Tax=Nonomuraea diastatica TaxID=1848329 RepID=A0A4R4WW99_9ACTN|nr:hypothetical protein [Nonomuraea diastatica]TDD22016.1 hypothetical protein E1294_13120 [Nonomuraea diastatica]